MKRYPKLYTKAEQLELLPTYMPVFSGPEIQELLGISRATYFRRLAELKERSRKRQPTEEETIRALRILAQLQQYAKG